MEDLNEKSNKTEKEEVAKPAKTEIVETPKPSSTSTTVFVASNKQVETRLPSGKRRITPMLLTPAPAPPK